MIGAVRKTTANLHVTSRIERGAKNHFLEQIGANQARTRKSRQPAAGAHQVQPQEIDVLVAARGRQHLRLGMGKFTNQEEIPEDLPTFVLCTGGAKARSLATMLIKLLEQEEPGPKEVIIFHAEEESARRGMMHELLQRVVSQQIAPSFRNHDVVLTVKILPETLVDGLIYLKKAHPFSKVFIGTGSDPETAERYARDLESNLGVSVVNIGRPTLLERANRQTSA